jgi:arsenite methyltransferase
MFRDGRPISYPDRAITFFRGDFMGRIPVFQKSQPDYGIDAPGLVRTFFAGGSAALLLSFLSICLLPSHPAWRAVVAIIMGVAALYLIGMGCLMLFWSKVIKINERDAILDQITWRGDERVLDVGCGRGLMLIAAAKRLTTGSAVGVDIWQAADQSGNTPESAWENARREGVADRIEVATGDARSLPFPDQSFDVVVSHWVIHNLPSQAERDRTLEEMDRALRPGGKVILADIENRDIYAAKLHALGFQNVRVVVSLRRDRVLRALSFGSFGPAALYAQKPQ